MGKSDEQRQGISRLRFLTSSRSLHFQVQNFAWFTFNENLEGPAAYFTISRKSLRWGACVNHQLKALAAVWALNGFADFHVQLRRRQPSRTEPELQAACSWRERQAFKRSAKTPINQEVLSSSLAGRLMAVLMGVSGIWGTPFGAAKSHLSD